MANMTKYALENALKGLLLQKPLEKITISDLTKSCGISRMAFYYHFKDIYDLIEWVCLEDAMKALEGKKTYATWHEGLVHIFEAILENKPFFMKVYHSITREQIENSLFRLTHDLIMNVVEEMSEGKDISEEEKIFIADFYKYSFVGVMLDWIRQGMKADYHDIAQKISITIDGNIVRSIENFTKEHR